MQQVNKPMGGSGGEQDRPLSLTITYIGHATVHLQSEGLSLFTDPVFSNHIWFLKRHSPLTVLPSELPEPTAILISHAHYDHLDLYTFKYFSSKIPIIVPNGLARLVSRFVKNPIIELSHHASHKITEGLEVTALPVAHRGSRLSWLTYPTCNGYLITLNGTKIFFPGDTGWRDDFKDVLKKMRGVGGRAGSSPDFSESSGSASDERIDVALLPLGPTKPEWLMHPRHLNPEEVIRLADLLQAKLTIPIHWGTFQLGLEPLNDPIDEFRRLVEEKKCSDRVRILPHGEKITV